MIDAAAYRLQDKKVQESNITIDCRYCASKDIFMPHRYAHNLPAHFVKKLNALIAGQLIQAETRTIQQRLPKRPFACEIQLIHA